MPVGIICHRRSDARLIFAGKLAELVPSFGTRPAGVEFSGFLPDLKALRARVRIVTCPIMAGSGTRLKLLEAAAYGKPMVVARVLMDGVDGLTA